MDMAVSDFPLPDSPTMPIILFFGTEKSISYNANCGVGRVKLTLSLKTDNKEFTSCVTGLFSFYFFKKSSIFKTLIE